MSFTKPLSKILFYISGITMGIVFLITAYFAIMSILALLGVMPNKMSMSIEMPIRLHDINDFYESNALVEGYESVRIEVEDARLKAVPNQSRIIQFGGYLVAAIYTSFFGLILFQLQKILENFKENRPFTHENAIDIRRIGWLTVGLVLFELIIHSIASWLFKNEFSVTNASFLEMSIFDKINFIALFLGLIILALSEVFQKGAILQENEDFTV